MPDIVCGELRTGRRLASIPVSDASWSVKHRAAGSIDITVPLDAEEFRKAIVTTSGLFPLLDLFPGGGLDPERPALTSSPDTEYRTDAIASLDGARCFLAVVEGDRVIEAGPIWRHDYDDTTRSLRVGAAGLWSLWDHRTVLRLLGAGENPATTSLAWSGLSLGTIAKRLVEVALSHAGGSLPLTLPADMAGEHERTYPGYELANLGQRLEELMGVDDGPDIAFRPYLTEDRLGIGWRMLHGDPFLAQVGEDWSWDTSAVRGSTSGLSVQRDFTGLASRAWVSGDGVEDESLIEFAASSELTDAGFPLLEVTETRSNVSERPTLQSWAQANLANASRPWMTWKFAVRRDAYPLVGQYQPGDWARVYIPGGHPYLRGLLPQGHYRARILEVSGDLSEWVQITCAPTPENR